MFLRRAVRNGAQKEINRRENKQIRRHRAEQRQRSRVIKQLRRRKQENKLAEKSRRLPSDDI